MKEARCQVFEWYHSMLHNIMYELEYGRLRQVDRQRWLKGLMDYYQKLDGKLTSIRKGQVVQTTRAYGKQQLMVKH